VAADPRGCTSLSSLPEISEAAEIVAQAASPRASIIFGAAIDPRLAHAVKITLAAMYGNPPHGQLQAGPGQLGGGPRRLIQLHSGPGCRGIPKHLTTTLPQSHRPLQTPRLNRIPSHRSHGFARERLAR
jgi:FtsZ family, C-terminal domain